MQNNLKRKREITEADNEYEPPRKIRVLDEDQVYISESSDNSSYDGDTTDGDLSSESDDKTTSDDRDFLETTNDSIPRGGDEDEYKPEISMKYDTPRQKKLREQWTEILPKLKRTKCSCDLFEEDCPYHFPKKDDEDDKNCIMCSS